MVTVVRSPPQRAALRRRAGHERQGELHRPGGGIGAMRAVAVIEGRDAEHAHCVEHHRDRDRDRADADPQRREARHMQGDERHHAQPVDAIVSLDVGCALPDLVVEPAPQRRQRAHGHDCGTLRMRLVS